MVSMFLHAVSFLLSKLFSRQIDRRTDRCMEKESEESICQNSVTISKTFGITGVIWFIVFAAFGILGVVIWADGMTDWDAFLCGILFLFLSLAGIYLMLLRRNYHIFYTDTFLEKHSMFGKKRVYHWADLTEIRQNGATYTLIFSGGKLRIFFSKEYIGSERFVDFLQKQYFFEKNA